MVRQKKPDSPAGPSSCGCSHTAQAPGPLAEVAVFLGALDLLVRSDLISLEARDEVLALLDSKGAFCESDSAGVGAGTSPVTVDPYQRAVTYDSDLKAGPGNYRSYHGYRILC